MDAFIVDGTRTPIGRYGGSLSGVRADDLAAHPLRALKERHDIDWAACDEVTLGCANQAGEDNRNVARMALLLAGLPESVPGVTVNRLCASGLDAVGLAARAIRSGDHHLCLAGGVESMSRAPYVVGKAQVPFDRAQAMQDTTIGWRFVNPAFHAAHGTHSMPETADEVAADWGVSRADQDAFAARSQARAEAAAAHRAEEITPVEIPQRKGGPVVVAEDEHPRPGTTAESLAKLRGINGPDLSVTAGNASGVNDGAAALLLAGERACAAHGLAPKARVVTIQSAGVAPRVMGVGPVPAVRKALAHVGLAMDDMDLVELNEAFAAQALAVTRDLGLADDDPRVNPNGGAIALGHPLGMSGARLALAAALHLGRTNGRYALVTMCVGVGQGTAMILESV
ncbi:3-oxoadipyl-CoA thiolase [Jannaschia sp. Os4]|uniref:3-oxoadipyl-CoA thiolase n=1 Tax=Jannaschia sp. Os4 TaxID=2807617 RepID=UPI0019393A07|nr:3-oxoadipyl-CoA thiolase [Jannaschia sp. Os4]MBM2576709.1 3-oxoadipyl-CoA thiolase [Jannaschia sp. Os4]